MAQELLTTFQEELDIVSLIPARVGSDSNPNGGKFAVSLNGEVLWDRAFEGGFPEIKELKSLVRDYVNPDRDLGHIEEKVNGSAGGEEDKDSAEIEALVKEIEAIDEEIKVLDESIGVMEKAEKGEVEEEESVPVAMESAPVMVVEESAPVVEESEPVVEESAPVAEESVPEVEESTPADEAAETAEPAENDWEPKSQVKAPLFNDFAQFGFENL